MSRLPVISCRKSGKSGETPDFGSEGSGGGGGGVMFILNVKKRVARKLHIMILLHFGLVAFNVHFPKKKEYHYVLFLSDLVDVPMTPNTNYS